VFWLGKGHHDGGSFHHRFSYSAFLFSQHLSREKQVLPQMVQDEVVRS